MRDIPEDQVLRRLRAENPWWEGDDSVLGSLFSRWRPRPYLDLLLPLLRAATPRRAVVLLGPRRVGKTVLLHHAIGRLLAEGAPATSLCYVSVDHPLYTGLGLEQLLDRYATATGRDPRRDRCTVVFDEIQYLRDWEIHLKALVDSYPELRCIASGSAAAALRLKSVESGAGRFTEFLLPPLTFHEFLLLLDRSHVIADAEADQAWSHPRDEAALNRSFGEYLNFGGYPEAAFSAEIQRDPGRFIKADIVDKVLLRDLPSLYGIQDVQELNSLFTMLAFNTANEVSLDDLTKRSGVAKNTVKRYVEYLEAAFLVRLVHRVDRNARRFQRANYFKVYLGNPSMRAALFSPLGLDDGGFGHLVETGIFAQWFHSDARLHYARWEGGGEVDVVSVSAAAQRVQWAVESKWTDRMVDHPDELRNVLRLARTHRLDRVTVTTRTVQRMLEVAGVSVDLVPAAVYCYDVGRNIVQGRTLDSLMLGKRPLLER